MFSHLVAVETWCDLPTVRLRQLLISRYNWAKVLKGPDASGLGPIKQMSSQVSWMLLFVEEQHKVFQRLCARTQMFRGGKEPSRGLRPSEHSDMSALFKY